MKIFASIFVAFATLLSCQSFTKSRFPAGSRPRHVIVSIHGIAGTENTFGFLLNALKEHINEVDQGYEVVTANFAYATGSDNATVAIFKEEFTKFMRQLFAENPITSQDRISIIAHSQGGLITTFWYVDALDNELTPTDKAIAQQVQNVVTESTPFWGAKGAYFAYDRLKFPPLRKLLQRYVRMSPGELKEMSFGSDTVYKFFVSGVDTLTQSPFESLVKLRMLNLSGVFPAWDNPFIQRMLDEHAPNLSKETYLKIQKEFFNIFNTGTRWESDSVVNSFAARIGFNYAVALGDYVNNQVLPLSAFHNSFFLGQTIPFQLIETVHASPEANRMMDIAYVPERCLEKDQCDHPSYKVIFKHVINCERENSTCDMKAYQNSLDILFHGDTSYGMNEHNQLMSQMQTFSIMLNLRLPKGYKVTHSMLNNDDVDEYIKPGYERYQSHISSLFDEDKDGLLKPLAKDQIYRVFLGRRAEAFSRIIKHFPAEQQLRFQFTGKVQPIESSPLYNVDSFKKMAVDGYKVRIKISLPNLKDRIVEVPVRPTYTNFIDLEMRP